MMAESKGFSYGFVIRHPSLQKGKKVGFMETDYSDIVYPKLSIIGTPRISYDEVYHYLVFNYWRLLLSLLAFGQVEELSRVPYSFLFLERDFMYVVNRSFVLIYGIRISISNLVRFFQVEL